jgi:hypothetical protein
MQQAVSEGVFPAQAKDPRFRELFDYWLSKTPPGRLPGRQHIDPLEIPHLLPGVALFDVLRNGTALRFRWRLLGTALVDAIGDDYTGRFVDEVGLLTIKYEAVHRVFSEIVHDKKPNYWETPLTRGGRDFICLQRLALPLAGDGNTVDMIIGYYIPVTRATYGAHSIGED